MPDLSGLHPIRYERYFLKDKDGVQERIQRRGDVYEREIKQALPQRGKVVIHKKEKYPLTKGDFNRLKIGKERDGIIRESYELSTRPPISIKIYQGRFEGLIRAEIEFDSAEEAATYVPEVWMGNEITTTPLGMDSRLLHLTKEEFESLLQRVSEGRS